MNKFSITICAVALTLYWGTAHAGGQTNVYDSLGRLNQVRTSDGVLTSYDYDPAGNRTQKRIQTVSQSMRAWEGENLPHLVGYADGEGWAANVSTSQSFLSFGPYVTDVTPGAHIGVWKMLVDNNSADNADIVNIDVNDATTQTVIASRRVTRGEWTAANKYEYFYLPFIWDSARQGHQIELRTSYMGYSYVRLDRIGLDATVLHGDDLAQMTRSWEAEALSHGTGFAEADGWAASVNSSSGALVFGPYTTVIPVGNHIAVWKMLVDNNAADERPVVTIDVNDATTGKLLAQTTVFRNAWKNANSYEYFGLPFVIDPSAVGHAIEIRVIYIGASYVRVDKVGYQ